MWSGVGLATLLLHTGLSSTRDDAIDAQHPTSDEPYDVPEATAAAVNVWVLSGLLVFGLSALAWLLTLSPAALWRMQ